MTSLTPCPNQRDPESAESKGFLPQSKDIFFLLLLYFFDWGMEIACCAFRLGLEVACYAFRLGLEPVQDVICLFASFDWGLKAVRECLLTGPGISEEARGFV